MCGSTLVIQTFALLCKLAMDWWRKLNCVSTHASYCLSQGSRLTAFELVHDNIPATLIADSAAAALMKAGNVQGVIVGADRVAANGTLMKYLSDR